MYDYSNEPRRIIFMIDNKSFYASVECIELGLNPLTTELVVMSRAKNTGQGLILATSPLAKKKYGLSNVSRPKSLPSKKEAPNLIIVEPHMNLYIKRSMQIVDIFKKYVADEDLHVYSIDESILDVTDSYKLFGKDPFEVARKIQLDVHDQLGLYTTVGIGENPVLAKFALDLDAKKRKSMIAFWHYLEVPDTLWEIQNLTDIWGISKRTEVRLNKLGITNVYELAHMSPKKLKKEFGVVGEQLFAMSWGVDRSLLRNKYFPKAKSYGNSQVLPRDYVDQRDIEVVIREIGEQVAARIRKRKLQTRCVSLSIGYSSLVDESTKGFTVQKQIMPSNSDNELTRELLHIFRQRWHGEPIRHVGVDYSKLVQAKVQQTNLFIDPEKQIKSQKLEETVDDLRKRFGFKAAIKASSLEKGGTALERMGLVGGHSGGNSYE